MKKIAVTAAVVFFCMASIGYALTTIYAPLCFGKTKDAWTRVYEELVSQDKTVKGHSYIISLEGNGRKDWLHKNNSRDTIIFIPEKTTAEKPMDFLFYFHGLGGFKERDFSMRTLRHTPSLSEKNNYVLIIPEMPWSRNTSTPRKRQGRVFAKEGQFATFTQSAMAVVNAHYRKLITINKAILVGHSAGGSALMSISRSGGVNWIHGQTDTRKVKIIFSDASYGRWLDNTWRGIRQHTTGIDIVVLTRKNYRPYHNARRFLKRLKEPSMEIRHVTFDRRKKSHGDIGDEALQWAYNVSSQ